MALLIRAIQDIHFTPATSNRNCTKRFSLIGNFNNSLPKVFALQHPRKAINRIFQSIRNVLLVLDRPLRNCRFSLFQEILRSINKCPGNTGAERSREGVVQPNIVFVNPFG